MRLQRALVSEPRDESVRSIGRHGYHRIAYRDWGDSAASVVFCVHGLSRNSHDFDPLARVLAPRRRVICPDLAGRGRSDWLVDPTDYHLIQYNLDMTVLAARVGAENFDWIGTSLGGLIGMALAAQGHSPLARLVLNDAGPVISRASLERIAGYVGTKMQFASLEDAEAYIRGISAPFGPHSDAQWRFLTETWLRRNDDGSWRAHYDPRIAEPFRATLPEKDMELWPVYDAIRCPTLVLRGETSDLLRRETAAEMARRGPQARVVEIAGVGHAPTLMHPDQIARVREFLLEGGPA